MLNIKVLGPGCANCYKVEGLAIAAVEVLDAQKPELFAGEQVTIEHLTTREDFARYGVMYTPGLVINEKLVTAGRIPSVLEIMPAIEKALAANKATERP